MITSTSEPCQGPARWRVKLQAAFENRISRWRDPEERIAHQASAISDPIARLRYLRSATPAPRTTAPRYGRIVWLAAPAVLVACAGFLMPRPRPVAASRTAPAVVQPASREPEVPNVWLVDKNRDAEMYSNGLRVELRHATESDPRSYRAFPRGSGPAELRSAPVGIVFHASESELAPFEPAEARHLKRQALGLLEWVRSKKLYNYVVDRIGRVYRVVNEEQRADHAGNSVWADEKHVYVNLNNSFIGVAFEARTGAPLEQAQVHAGRILVEMLRSRFKLPASNCVTHAQVSVNPANFRVGYHTDWVSNFPFRELGLTENYDRPLPSLSLFGFLYDPAYLESAAQPLRDAVLRTEAQVEREAGQNNVSPAAHRQSLRARYKELRAAVMPPEQESSNAY